MFRVRSPPLPPSEIGGGCRKNAYAPLLVKGGRASCDPLVRAATVTVTSTLDVIHDGTSGCAITGSGICSLRDGVIYANAHANTIIALPAGTYVLTIWSSGSNDATTGDLNLTNTTGSTTIFGAGSDTTIIDGNHIDRLFQLSPGVTANISGITLRNGALFGQAAGPTAGGAILNDGTVTITGCVFAFNGIIGSTGTSGSPTGREGDGGAIANRTGGSLTVINSTFTMNGTIGGRGVTGAPSSTGGFGGGGAGGGGRGGAATGGALWNDGPNAIVNLTIFANNAVAGSGGATPGGGTGPGGAIGVGGINAPSPLQITNTIIANNLGGANCTNTLTDNEHNLEFPTNTCGFTPGAPKFDQVGDPMLGPLASNGGPTQTMAFTIGSAAINHGDNAACAGPLVGNVDQRGIARPYLVRGNCGIGAFEYNTPPSAAPGVRPGPLPSGGPPAVMPGIRPGPPPVGGPPAPMPTPR